MGQEDGLGQIAEVKGSPVLDPPSSAAPMSEAQRVWLQHFLRLPAHQPGGQPRSPATELLAEAPDDGGTPPGGGGDSTAPVAAPLADKQKSDRAMGQLRARYAQVKNPDQTFETQEANQA